eukprot:TRINITY_DN136093_c0_g1_i1.p1 TRINITY_DN136093_c0_g1~~TRINITY_DN136093_c0_g1_i1.p1  ORF type:complete len:730 (+),score=30.95 TRINITY_DN136093_c0_g1_i1:418-2607(+)
MIYSYSYYIYLYWLLSTSATIAPNWSFFVARSLLWSSTLRYFLPLLQYTRKSLTTRPYLPRNSRPQILLRVLIWHGGMLFLHIFYVHNWVMTLYTYIVVYIEIMATIFYTFGGKLIREDAVGTAVDTSYYVILFAGFVGLSVFAVRTYEIRERAGFFSQLNSEHEMKCWKELLNDLPEPVILSQGRSLTFCNNATYKFLDEHGTRLTDAEIMAKLALVKQNIPSQLTLEDLVKDSSLLSHEGITSYFTYPFKGKDRKIEVKGVQIKYKDGSTIVQHIIHDITALEDLEREKAQRHCFQLLVATASHDIRTPINAIQGAVENLSGTLMDKDSQQQLKMAQIAVKKLLLYIRGLAYLEHIETNSLQVDRIPFDVPRTVQEMLNYFEFSIQAKNLDVPVHAQSTIPLIVSDKEKYETILYHLLDNAVKYTFTGKIEIIITYSYDDGTLVTQIKDTGIGIKPEQKKDLFKLFASHQHRNELNPQGIGLGLYTAQKLSKELGGELTVNSTYRAGTTVTFSIKQAARVELTEPMTETDVMLENVNEGREYLPLPSMLTFLGNMPSSLATSAPEVNRPCSPEASERGLLEPQRVLVLPKSLARIESSVCLGCNCNKVLIVDDDPMNIMVLNNYLPALNLAADTVQNGQEALDAILARRKSCEYCKGYRLILMDINMPVMDGIEATQRIVEMIKEKVIPMADIVAVTAAAHLEVKNVASRYKKVGFTSIRMVLQLQH